MENSNSQNERENLQEVDTPTITKKEDFLSKTTDELKLVVWPTRQQLFSESIAVILMVTLSAASIAAVSRFYGWASSQIFL